MPRAIDYYSLSASVVTEGVRTGTEFAGVDPTQPADWATVMEAVLKGMRAMDVVWGGRPTFGGPEPVEAAARYLAAVIQAEVRPGGKWEELSDPSEDEDPRANTLRVLLKAAKKYVTQCELLVTGGK